MPGATQVSTLTAYRDVDAARRARGWRRVGLALIGVVLLLGVAGLLGIRSTTVTARSAEGYELEVTHAQVTRAGIAGKTASEGRLIYEFDPPPGDVFRLSLDARTAPDQNGSADTYRTALVVEGRRVAQVGFRMWVVP